MAESTTYRFAKHDKEKYPDIITGNGDCGTPYYTNSSHLPVGYTEDIFDALDIQDELQTLYTSGTVFHAFLGEKLPDWKSAAKLVKTIADNYKLPYFTLSPTYSICKEHGYINGEHFTCPECGKSAEVYSRITGYYRPVQNWNEGKIQEFKDRKEYDMKHSKLHKHTPIKEEIKEKERKEEKCDLKDGVYLITTKNCPNCPLARKVLEEKGIGYTELDAKENMELCRKLNIMQAPTLLITKDGVGKIISGISEITKYYE